MKLRRWQAEALAVVEPRVKPGFAGVMSVCTRAGKSIFMAALVERLPITIDIVTSRTRLVDDLVEVCGSDGCPVGRFDGRRKEEGRVRITTYQSLALALEVRQPAMVICDEAHHTGSPGVVELLKAVPIRLGLTATAYRGNVRQTLPLFDEVVYSLSLAQAMDDGIIVPFRPWWPTGEPAEMGAQASLEAAAAEVARRGGPGVCGPLLVTAPDLGSAMGGAKWLRSQGWRAEATGSHLSRREQDALLGGLKARQLDALVFVDLLTEGVTVPCARGLILAAGLGRQGRVRLAQTVGRVLGADEGKTEAIIFDPCGALIRHKLESTAALGEEPPREEREYKTPAARARAVMRGLEAYPRALAITDVDAWLVEAAMSVGLDAEPRPESFALPATEQQRIGLARKLRGRAASIIQDCTVREFLRLLPDSTTLSMGSASRLWRLLLLAEQRYRTWLFATEGSPWPVRQRRQPAWRIDLSTLPLPGAP